MSQINEKKKILYLGGSASIKGFETVVKSLDFLDDKIVLLIAGTLEKHKFFLNPKKMYSNVKELLKQKNKKIELLKKSDNVIILGKLKDPYPFIDECDILITPFKISHFSRPAIEAFAYGKPVIGSDVEGMEEIIDNGINGLIIKKNEPELLAKAINFLCKNPGKAQSFGFWGRKKAIQLFSINVNMKKIEKIYSRVG
jgi:glycosyltransferase involved in cell wall biosynthesis